ncbi:MAG: restriction endonuclease [Verrucomicrobia bacterium]|nr:restriction endonuclease [Verrucomicrobiota bacterium]
MAAASTILSDLPQPVREAVRFYWQTRTKQLEKQAGSGAKDQGLRSAVTGGAQMDGFLSLLTKLVIEAGIDRKHVFCNESIELPGYFCPTEQWEFLVVVDCQLVAALKAKSQGGLSFENNFNNSFQEALGSAHDLWASFRQGTFGTGVRPWLGYLFLLEDCAASRTPTGVKEPHFKVSEEFWNSSYARRYEIFCRRLVLERHYDSAVFLLSQSEAGRKGDFTEPAADLGFEKFARLLVAQAAAFSGRIRELIKTRRPRDQPAS